MQLGPASLLILIGFSDAALARQTPVEAPALAAIRSRVAADCTAGRFSGVIVAQRRGEIVYRQTCGFVDEARRIPITPRARFRLFSLSKSFTATAILRLVERRRIGLDRPIRHYLPAAPEAWRAVTVRHLLQHQSGIPDLTEQLLHAYRDGARTHTAAMNIVFARLTDGNATLANAPGSAWRYSNFGYELLARIAEVVERRPFHQVMRREVLEPAGMATATMARPAPGDGPLASGPDAGLVQGFNGAADRWEPATSFSFVQQGAGALHASSRDLLAFDAALSAGTLLSAAMQARNVADSVRATDTVRYGFGWLIRTANGCTYWQHSGGTNGFAIEFARAPEPGIAVAILSNLGFADVSALRRDLMLALLPSPDSPDRCTRG